MPDTVNIGIGANARKSVAEALAKVLADTVVLNQKTHGFHWNVTGPHFHDLHKLFEAQYGDLEAAIDEIAERIRALGHTAPGSLAQFLKLASLKEEGGAPDWQAMVRQLADDNESASRGARAALEVAQKAGDEATADMLIERMDGHDKAAWMLRSILA
jgi:starvation-inducible DNA-binding protein